MRAHEERAAYRIVGHPVAKPRHPLGGFGDEHAGVVGARRDEQRREVADRNGLVGRVGGDEVVCRGVGDRVAPLLLLGDRQRQARVEHRREDVDEGHLGEHGPEPPGGLRRCSGDQQPTGRASLRSNPIGCRPALVHQRVGAAEEVGEACLLYTSRCV